MVGDSKKCKCIDCIFLSLEEVLYGRRQLEM